LEQKVSQKALVKSALANNIYDLLMKWGGLQVRDIAYMVRMSEKEVQAACEALWESGLAYRLEGEFGDYQWVAVDIYSKPKKERPSNR